MVKEIYITALVAVLAITTCFTSVCYAAETSGELKHYIGDAVNAG